jgi:hypothetical protein
MVSQRPVLGLESYIARKAHNGVRNASAGTVLRRHCGNGCVVSAALFQLAILIFSFSSPLAITAVTLVAVALFHSLRRRIRARTGTDSVREIRMAFIVKQVHEHNTPAEVAYAIG